MLALAAGTQWILTATATVVGFCLSIFLIAAIPTLLVSRQTLEDWYIAQIISFIVLMS